MPDPDLDALHCPECNGKGEVLDASQNVLDGRPYWNPCPTCKGTGKRDDLDALRQQVARWKADVQAGSMDGLTIDHAEILVDTLLARLDAQQQELHTLKDAIAPYRHTPEDAELWTEPQSFVRDVRNMREVGEQNAELQQRLDAVRAAWQEMDKQCKDKRQDGGWFLWLDAVEYWRDRLAAVLTGASND